ncbi:hypothetical protein U1Q18_028364, partial [Sarracenia purpurea var. burkii]
PNQQSLPSAGKPTFKEVLQGAAGSPRPEVAVMATKSSIKGVTKENSRQDACVVSTIQEPREQGEPPKALEQGSNLGEIETDYAKDNMKITDKEDMPTMSTFHRKGKPSFVTYN